ncbi:hypothetical protein RUM44_011954 [Polyplax serrata]|uniref:Uncharacterized protein n=1 Tax=Polyplax serrata TaxID=468196 RepID=A0ABR1BEV5_POLSC
MWMKPTEVKKTKTTTWKKTQKKMRERAEENKKMIRGEKREKAFKSQKVPLSDFIVLLPQDKQIVIFELRRYVKRILMLFAIQFVLNWRALETTGKGNSIIISQYEEEIDPYSRQTKKFFLLCSFLNATVRPNLAVYAFMNKKNKKQCEEQNEEKSVLCKKENMAETRRSLEEKVGEGESKSAIKIFTLTKRTNMVDGWMGEQNM